jgi:hypothetical protein
MQIQIAAVANAFIVFAPICVEGRTAKSMPARKHITRLMLLARNRVWWRASMAVPRTIVFRSDMFLRRLLSKIVVLRGRTNEDRL